MPQPTEVEITLSYENTQKRYKLIEIINNEIKIEIELSPTMVEQYLSDILIMHSKTIERLTIETQFLAQEGQTIFKLLQAKMQNKNQKFPKLNSFFLNGQQKKINLLETTKHLSKKSYMDLQNNKADAISDFVSIFSATLKCLKISLNGKDLLLEGFNDLVNKIPHYAPEIEDLQLALQLNNLPSNNQKQDQIMFGTFDELLKLEKLSHLTVDLNISNLEITNIFSQLVSGPINHTIKELNLISDKVDLDVETDLEFLSPIFNKFVALESLKLDLTGLQSKNPAPSFLLSMSQSKLKEFSIQLYKGNLSLFTANEFMEIVCSSKHLKKLNVQFCVTREINWDCLEVFHMLKLSSSLETLTLIIFSNELTDKYFLHFSEGILAAGPQLSKIDLSFLVFGHQVSLKSINILEKAILSRPVLYDAKMTFTANMFQTKKAPTLKKWQTNKIATIIFIMACKINILPMQIINPTHVLLDLYM